MNPVIVPILSLVVILNFIVGIVILSRGFKNKVNLLFGLISFGVALWAAAILGFYLIETPLARFWILGTHSAAAAIAVIFLIFTFNFPTLLTKKIYIRLMPLVPFFIILYYLLFTKEVIGNVHGISYEVSNGYIFYSFFVMVCFFIGYYALFLQYKNSSNNEQKLQVKYVLVGAILSSLLASVSDLMLPYFGIFEYNWLGPIFTFFLVGATAYAILKHHLFDIKVVATELLTFAICLIISVRTFLSGTVQDLAINGAILILVFFFSILLIRSIIKEVKQKEKMEKMAGDIEKAYEAEKLAKERVEAAQVEDEALLTSIGDGVVAIDKEGKIMFINRAAQELLALKSEDVIGKPFEKILTIENEKGEAILGENNPLRQALSSGKKIVTDASGGALNMVYYYVRADKTKFPAAVTVAPVILGKKIIGAVDVFRDVTVERQIDRSKSEFVSLASHQLRTPLTAIKWYSEILQKEKLTVKQKRCIKEIYHGNERMIKLIDIMLNISRFEAGKIKVNAVKTNIKKLLEDIIKEQKSEIERRKEKFVFECPNDLPEILIDQNLFRLIFQNLISNAVKYTANEGQVSCKVSKKDNIFSFEVADTGIGIPEAQQKRIFEKLFRADNAFTHEPEGNGLGLYAAKMTTESLGGKIWFKSKQGKGTTFFVELPIKVVV